MKHRFLPVRENRYPFLQQQQQTEREFFTSLSHLASLYRFKLPEVANQPFPFNITAAYNQAKEILKQISPKLHLIIVQDDNHLACLATVEIYSTGPALYYIPVRPLVDLIKTRERNPAAQLIMSIFAYLRHKVKIPYYRDDSAYLSYCYDAVAGWYEDSEDLDEAERKEYLQQSKELRKGGDLIYKCTNNTVHLNEFEKRLKCFIPSDDIETDLLEVAKTAFKLMQAYPMRSLFDSIPEHLLNPEIDERITADRYLSFLWDSKGTICDNLMEYVNSDLQEYGTIDEPASLQLFHTPQEKITHDLSFETGVFNLMDDLCTILNEII